MKTLHSILLFCCLAVAASAATPAPGRKYVEGEVLITFKKTITLQAAGQVLSRHSLKFKRHFDTLSRRSGQIMGYIRAEGRTTSSLIAELTQEPSVQFVEPNYLLHTCATVPNDTYFPLLWGLQNTGQNVNGTSGTAGADIKFPAAWALARPSTNPVVIGVIDTGIDFTHPDLASNLWTNPYVASDATNGYPGDLHGYDFAANDANIFDSGYHGTHVSGIAAALGNNHLGVIGADYQAQIMVLKASSDGQNFSEAAVDDAIDYAVMMRGRGVNIVVLNASFGGGSGDNTMSVAIQTAGDDGIIFCAAADNYGTDIDENPDYPASYDLPNMIVVAASDQNDNLASFSDYGAGSVHLAAPGVNIWSTIPFNQATPTASVIKGTDTYSATGLTYAGVTTNITANIYYCAAGNPGDFPPSVSNNIALITLGALTPSNAVFNAMALGAQAVILYTNAPGSFTFSLGSPAAWIPAVSVAQGDGQVIQASLPAVGTVVNAINPSQLYGFLDGTSMSTAYVSGAVAFAAMNFPTESVSQRINRILNNVDVIPSLSGYVITSGRLDLQRTVDTDTNGLPDWWEQMYFGHLTGTDPNADPDHDGLSNLQEWQAGTNPTNYFSCLRMAGVTRGASGPGVTWQSVNNRNYFVEYSTNLAGSPYVQIIATNLPGQIGTTTFIDTNAPGSRQRFYQVGTGLDPFP